MVKRVYVETNGIREYVEPRDVIEKEDGGCTLMINNQDHPQAYTRNMLYGFFGMTLPIKVGEEEVPDPPETPEG